MNNLTLLKICMVISSIVTALLTFAAFLTISQMYAALPLPMLLVLMSYTAAAMCLFAGLTSYYLVKYRKRAAICAAITATTPAWPLVLSLFDTEGLFDQINLFPTSMLAVTIIFASIAAVSVKLTREAVLK